MHKFVGRLDAANRDDLELLFLGRLAPKAVRREPRFIRLCTACAFPDGNRDGEFGRMLTPEEVLVFDIMES